ncbi:MAG: NADH-quinone oxidoreductase subunit C [Actinocatenispora sp.]
MSASEPGAGTGDPAALAARVAESWGADCVGTVSGGGGYARATVDVPVSRWLDSVRAARTDLGCDFFDWLSAVDELADGFRIVAHVWSVSERYGLLLRTLVPLAEPRVASIVAVYPGAAWHEREAYEMFGVEFTGHPDLKTLLLPEGFEGHPLRKEFVLASRVVKAWPGAKEPGESTAARPGTGGRRAPMRPPGVPEPGEWGPAPEPDGDG